MADKFAIVVITTGESVGGLKVDQVDFKIYEVDPEVAEDVYQRELEALRRYPFYKAVYLTKILREKER